MTGSVLRNRRTNYYSHNYYNKIALQSRCRRPVSNARRDNKERNAGGLAGWRRPIVTKRGPMVHGIQFYISRVLKDERGGTKSKGKKKWSLLRSFENIFETHIYSRYIYQAHFPARPTASPSKKKKKRERKFDEISSRKFGGVYRGDENANNRVFITDAYREWVCDERKRDCRLM